MRWSGDATGGYAAILAGKRCLPTSSTSRSGVGGFNSSGFAARQASGVGPAVVSAPVVTTLVDATELVIHFLVAKFILGV